MNDIADFAAACSRRNDSSFATFLLLCFFGLGILFLLSPSKFYFGHSADGFVVQFLILQKI